MKEFKFQKINKKGGHKSDFFFYQCHKSDMSATFCVLFMFSENNLEMMVYVYHFFYKGKVGVIVLLLWFFKSWPLEDHITL